MNRPDWCPQDVWATANDVCNALGYILVDDQIAIARAIQNERERCAKVADDLPRCELVKASDEVSAKRAFKTGAGAQARSIAAAIRAGDPA